MQLVSWIKAATHINIILRFFNFKLDFTRICGFLLHPSVRIHVDSRNQKRNSPQPCLLEALKMRSNLIQIVLLFPKNVWDESRWWEGQDLVQKGEQMLDWSQSTNFLFFFSFFFFTRWVFFSFFLFFFLLDGYMGGTSLSNKYHTINSTYRSKTANNFYVLLIICWRSLVAWCSSWKPEGVSILKRMLTLPSFYFWLSIKKRTWFYSNYMWSDQANWVWSRLKSIFIFLMYTVCKSTFYNSPGIEISQFVPKKQAFEGLKKNRKLKLSALFGYILKMGHSSPTQTGVYTLCHGFFS